MFGGLVLLPVMFTSLYACYCDIFPTGKAAPPPPIEGNAFTPDKDVF